MKLSSMGQRVALGAMLLLGALAATRAAESYHLLKKYAFPSAKGFRKEYYHYITIDSAARRVYLSHGTEIIVLDADSGSVLGTIEHLQRTHGVAIAAEFGRGFITDGEAGKVIIFDLKTLKVTGKVKAESAYSLAYDPVSKRVIVMDGKPDTATVIDAKSGSVVGTIDLGGNSSPEFAVADGKGTVFVNFENKNEVAAIDLNTLKIKSRWPLAPMGMPSALAMDTAHRRLFSAGQKPQYLVVLDADSGRVIQTFPISSGVGGAVFAPETGMLYVSTGEGFVHIFHEDSPDQYSEVETLQTEFGAKTIGLDTKTQSIFVDTVDYAIPAPTMEKPNPKPKPVEGTFRLLVYGK